jgi:hypothetical protein
MEAQMNVEQFRVLIQTVTDAVKGKQIDRPLAEELERMFPADGDDFRAIEAACHKGVEEGWMCEHGEAGMKFGRVVKPSEETAGFSVDVVDMKDVKGPHHRHPNGEICMVMPRTPAARFDGHGRGWCVYPAGSAHHPTVTNGEALVLYMLPEGKIEFTGQ